jgi:IS1 family transposase
MNWKHLSAQKKRVRHAEVPAECKAHTRHKIWLWTAVNHFQPGILGWVMGDNSAKTFQPLWELVGSWKCYFYITDGWPVYPIFIPDGDQIICRLVR